MVKESFRGSGKLSYPKKHSPGAGESRKTLVWMGCVKTVQSAGQLFPNGGCLLGGHWMHTRKGDGARWQKRHPIPRVRGLKLPTQYLDISKCLEWNLHPTGYLDDPGNLGWQTPAAQEPDRVMEVAARRDRKEKIFQRRP